MQTMTLKILGRALERVEHGWPTFDGALKQYHRTTDDVWKEVDDLVFAARLEHDGGQDPVPPLPRYSPEAPVHERSLLSPWFFWWRQALENAHACVRNGAPWEDGPNGSGLTRPQAVTVLCFAILLAQKDAKGLEVAPGEVEARARLRAKYLGEGRPKQAGLALLGEVAKRPPR